MNENSLDDASPRPIEPGDFLFIGLGSAPTPLEKRMKEVILESPDYNPSMKMVRFYLLPIRGVSKYLQIPAIDLPDNVSISIFDTENSGNIEFPEITITYPRKAMAGNIQVSQKTLDFSNELILMIFFDISIDIFRSSVIINSLIGIISSSLGGSLLNSFICDGIFNLEECKICIQKVKLDKGCIGCISGFDVSNLGIDHLNVGIEKIERCFWMLGRAHFSKTKYEKIVFYHAAFEIITNCNQKNFIRKIYKSDRCLTKKAIDAIDSLNSLRNRLLHEGVVFDVDIGCERLLRSIIMDAVVYMQCGMLPVPLARALFPMCEATG